MTVGVDDSAVDSDGDGSPDGHELRNMSDPTDPSSFFQILSLAKAPGHTPAFPLVEVTLNTFPGLDYALIGGFQPDGFFFSLQGSNFTATDYTSTQTALFGLGRFFVKGVRN